MVFGFECLIRDEARVNPAGGSCNTGSFASRDIWRSDTSSVGTSTAKNEWYSREEALFDWIVMVELLLWGWLWSRAR